MDEDNRPAATVKVLLIAVGCVNAHIVCAKTDGYLDLSSVWNVSVDRWLGDRFIRQSDYSDNSFGLRGLSGMSSMRYKYTARFQQQDSVQFANKLFTAVCCGGIGTWYGNIVLCAHEPNTGEVLSIAWDSHTRKFHWTENAEKSVKRRPRDLAIVDVPEVLHLLAW